MSLLEKIVDAKEIIGDDAALLIADHYNIKEFDEVDLKGCCPFHEEKTPSFIWNKRDKAFRCFGCGKRLGILDLYIETEGSYKKALERLFSETNIEFNISSLKTDKEDFFEHYKFPVEENNENRARVEEYSSKRGISVETLDYMKVKEDKHGNVVFELRDLDDVLVAVKYRPSQQITNDMPKMWWQPDSDKCPSLYNINRVDVSSPLVVVEGYYDALAIVEAGIRNVVSIPGGAEDANWIEFNWDFLDNVEQFIFWFDNDETGKKGLEKVVNRIGEYRCKIVKPTKDDEQFVIDFFDAGKKRSKKINKTDANNILLACGKERIISLINNAEEIPSKRLKYLMDFEVDNVKEVEKCSMGIHELDKIMYGNLFPCFTIYSGKPGSGKSSIANTTCIAAPIDQGYKAFVFSGELPKGQLLDWNMAVLAGYNHTQELKQSDSQMRSYYIVTNEAQKEIKSFYRKSIIIYDDSDELEVDDHSLLKEMENAYRKYGCRIFLIDNLMCINIEDPESDNEWKAQKKFILKLMNFSKKYKVSVNLVLHPKKMNFAKKPSTDDLHGASEIGNLCHRMFWVDRLEEPDNIYNTKITVIKDRPTQSAGKSCDLYYDEKTRRFFSTIEELKYKYSWENNLEIKYDRETESKLIYHNILHSLPHEDVPM